MVELLVAMTISIIVIGATLSSIGTIYYGQKRLRISQDFYKEVKFIKQRLVDLSRDNTIDYDRYFLALGPDPDKCEEFHPNQQPFISVGSNDDCHSETDTPISSTKCNNDADNRAKLGYETIFYWDTNADNQPDRNMGGLVFESGSTPIADNCTQAFYEQSNNLIIDFADTEMPALFLINRDREIRRAFRRSTYEALVQGSNTTLGRIELQTQLGADTDDDGVIDIWGPLDDDEDGLPDVGDTFLEWYTSGSTEYCRMGVKESSSASPVYYDIVGNITNREFCEQAHDWVPMSIRNINIEALDLKVTPDRDPYLAFRNNAIQIHPRTTIRMTSSLTDPVAFGFDQDITITAQTTVSSRIFGNTR